MRAARANDQRLRRSRLSLVLLLALAITGSAMLPLGVSARSGLGLAAYLAPIARYLQPLAGADAVSTGGDGRLTVLLLGSDYRSWKSNGERTDQILLLTINPNTHKMAMASIPRDIARIPQPPSGKLFKGRINGMVKYYTKYYGSRAKGLQKFEEALEYTLKIQIDYHAIARFDGFNAMLDEMGPVRVNISSTVKDPKLWDKDPVGVYFPAASNWALVGSPTSTYPNCRGWWWHSPGDTWRSGYECHRGLFFVRTRKGKNNSDFKRQARGQEMAWAMIKQVVNNNSGNLGGLASEANSLGSNLYIGRNGTRVYPTAQDTLALVNIFNGANFANRVVFRPKTYASHISGTSTYQLRLTVVRNWINSYFKNI
jgi:hypothetical protein